MTINAAIKIKYLTNRELLEQIHASKNTYCSYLENIYSNFDIITHDLNLITRETLEAAKIKKAELQTARLRKEAQARGEKNPSYRVDPESLDIEHVVVRLMTYDHIPPHPVKHQTGKTVAERHVKINFPAFQHYVWCNDNWLCVGKSHWRGGLQNGEFCNNHGYITNKLAFMFMKLVEKYSKKGNWRGYCVDDQTQALTQRGWLSFDQIGNDDLVLSYDDGHCEWNPVVDIVKQTYQGNVYHITHPTLDTMITPGHKLVTSRGLISVENLTKDDYIILQAPASNAAAFLSNTEVKIKAGDLNFNGMWGQPNMYYSGIVWCPKTLKGSWVARRNSTIFLTGNTYNDEMQGQALLQLSQIGLQFDESRSENPFAYYTSAVQNSFTRILNTEKRNQNIRDDLLIMHGSTPSYTRQTEHEIAQKTAE